MKLLILLLVTHLAISANAQVNTLENALQAVQSIHNDEVNTVVSSENYSQLLYHGAKTEKSILIIHGLYESPRFTKTYMNYFYNQGYNVYSLLLPGHFRKAPHALAQVHADEWVRQTELAYSIVQQLGNHVELMGYSLGGTLSAYLTLKHPNEIQAMYLVSPGFSLSWSVFLGSTALAWSNLDSFQICRVPSSTICQLYLKADPQLAMNVRDGIDIVPAAGFEVANLLGLIADEFGSVSPDGTDRLTMAYGKMKLPIAMVNSEADNVTDPAYNESFIQSYQGMKTDFMYPKSQNVLHSLIAKGPDDAFVNTKPGYNQDYQKILDCFAKLQTQMAK